MSGEDVKNQKIRVGIIGLGGWAKYGHIPALQSLKDEYEIVAVMRRRNSALRAKTIIFN